MHKTKWLQLAAVGALGISAFGQGHSHLLPAGNKVNPRGLSQGAKMWWYGPQPATGTLVREPRGTSTYPNVDAANVNEDLAGGQAETAIAASGLTVMAAWNDSTGFFVLPTNNPLASITGVGLSLDGGVTFTDLGGLPNNNSNQQWFGDPSVVAVDNGAYFIVSSMYLPVLIDCTQGPSQYAVAVSVAQVTQTGVVFSNPVIAATGGDYCSATGPTGILDKDFMTYDTTTRTLAITFSNFTFTGTGMGQIELVTAQVPATPSTLSAANFSAPVIVWPEEGFVENEGAYPALAFNSQTGADDVYIAWERNWFSNRGNGDPYVYINVAEVRAGSVIAGGQSSPVVVTQGQLNASSSGGVKSMDLEQIIGYSRGFGNDYPRIAYNSPKNRIAIVWNDASHHPLGDIFMRSYGAGLTTPSAIMKINSDNSGALHFLPTVCFLTDGSMVTSWYDRRNYGPTASLTDYWGDIRQLPAAASSNFQITTAATDWLRTGSIINPNFGDYTDVACSGTQPYFTWSDGRLGVSQPFVAP